MVFLFLSRQQIKMKKRLKMARNKSDLNDVTAAPFSVSFSQLPAAKKRKNGAAVTPLRSFLFHDDFTILSAPLKTFVSSCFVRALVLKFNI